MLVPRLTNSRNAEALRNRALAPFPFLFSYASFSSESSVATTPEKWEGQDNHAIEIAMDLPLDHVGIAVQSLDEGLELYRKSFGLKLELREMVPSQGVEIAFLKLENTLMELLAPTSPESTLAKFIQKRGPGLHHLCYRVVDIRAELMRLEKGGFTLIDKEPRPGAHHSLIAFLHPKDFNGVLIELCERAHIENLA